MDAAATNPPTPTTPTEDPWASTGDPGPTVQQQESNRAQLRASLYELLRDLVRAERDARDNDKWYGDWDDTHLQHVALDNEEARVETLGRDALQTAFADFRIETRMHLDVCPTLAGQADERRRRLPALHGLGREQATQLRERAQALRSDDDTDLTLAARHALANLYEAHAMLGDVFWDEGGCVTWIVDDIPGW